MTGPDEDASARARFTRRKIIKILGGVLLVAGGIWGIAHLAGGREAATAHANPTMRALRGPLHITVLEGGSIEALESQEIRSEVKGHQGTKILSIVEEGYRVTEDDVRDKKVLVQLDSSELEEKLKNQQIQIESTSASLIEAQKSYEIQINQNESDVQTAGLEAKFARMDLQKYLGAQLTEKILAESQVLDRLEREFSAAAAAPPQRAQLPADTSIPNEAGESVAITPAPHSSAEDSPMRVEIAVAAPSAHVSLLDFSRYAEVDLLGDGEARQKLRELEDKLLVAREELSLAETELESTERLVAKQYETQRELENDRLTVEKHRISVAASQTAQQLFVTYEFPKEAEKLLSDYVEKLRKLQRTEKEAQSKLAQAEAKLRSAEARFEIESQQLKEIKDQLAKCTIVAERPGLVVYGGGNDRWYGQERIQEGATVRERQQIVTIPDMTKMSVSVKIHESDIKKIATGQKATVRIDAEPDRRLDGEVIKVGVLPDAEQRWMNPDLKVYTTSVRIDGVHEWLKPGMSAQVEIHVATVEDVVYVPVQAVHHAGDNRVCYVSTLAGPRREVVETGAFTNEFIEIKSGLHLGDVVFLLAPDGTDEPAGKESADDKDTDDAPVEVEVTAEGPAAAVTG